MKVLLMALSMLAPALSHAMPCDVQAMEVRCQNAKGDVKISVGLCGFDLAPNSNTLEVKGRPNLQYALEQDFHGALFTVFSFKITDPKDEGKETVMTFEISNKTGRGLMVEKTRNMNPAPWRTLRSEPIRCVFAD